MAGSKIRTMVLVATAACALFLLGAYGGHIGPGERGAFTMNFPATGKECGGPSPRDLTGLVVVRMDRQGTLKRVLQPNRIEVASHVVRNLSDRPLTIRFEGTGFPPGTHWHSRDKSWSAEDRSIARPIGPGEAVDLSILMDVPTQSMPSGRYVDARIAVVDATTGARLSELPVVVVASAAAEQKAADCCGP